MDTKENKSNFEFDNPQLIESIFLQNLQYEGDLSKITNLPFQFEKTINKITQMQDNQHCATTVFLSATTNDKIELTKSTPCYIRITMKADFFWNKNVINEKEANIFLNINAPALLLSYIRPKVHDLTKDSKIPVQDIPFVDFTQQ